MNDDRDADSKSDSPVSDTNRDHKTLKRPASPRADSLENDKNKRPKTSSDWRALLELLPDSGQAAEEIKGNLEWTQVEIKYLVKCVCFWRQHLSLSDRRELRRFNWMWNWALAALNYYGAHHPDAPMTRQLQKLMAAHVDVTRAIALANANQTQPTTPDGPQSKPPPPTSAEELMELNEHIPIPSIIVSLSSDGIALKPPEPNESICQLLGYSKTELRELCTALSGWRVVMAPESYMHMHKSMIRAWMQGADEVIITNNYVRRDGSKFQSLCTCRIIYDSEGVPLTLANYIQLPGSIGSGANSRSSGDMPSRSPRITGRSPSSMTSSSATPQNSEGSTPPPPPL